MATMARLQTCLLKKLDLERRGGVLFHRDERTLILMDAAVFGSAQAKLVEERFPHVAFAVASCATSASGFIVVFTCDADGARTWHRATVRLLLHLLCLGGAAWLAR